MPHHIDEPVEWQYKRLIKDKPKIGDYGQYAFDNTLSGDGSDYDDYLYRDHSGSLGISPYGDKFNNKDLYTVVQEVKENDLIVDYRLAYPNPARLTFNTINIANNPSQAIHLYFLIHPEINVAAVAIKTIDNTKPKTSSP